MRKGMGFAAGAFFGIFLVATCTTDTTAPIINADLGMRSGADLAARDFAGFDLTGVSFDIAKANAAGATAVTCDKTSTHTVVYSTFTITYTYYLAELAVPGLQPSDSPHVTATGCNNTYFGLSGP